MVTKVIDATEMRAGTFLKIDGQPYQVKKMDVSKTGKHGHAKVRFEAISVMSGKKKVGVVPGHEKFEVPMIDKRKAQVLSINGNHVNLMDSVSFENLDLEIPEELKESVENIASGSEIEYWEIEGQKILKRA